MPITDRVERVPIDKIKVNREGRQRREIDIEDLLPSIQTIGVINPIIIDEHFNLRAGERRLTAAKAAGHTDIIARFFEDLSEVEHDIIEFEENAKRSDLPWQEFVLALCRIHEKLLAADETWNPAKTATKVSISDRAVYYILEVGEKLLAGDEKIKAANSWRAAYNMIARVKDRAVTSALADLISTINTPAEVAKSIEGEPSPPPEPVLVKEIPQPIHCLDFHEWVSTYSGPKFNFLHCDFPYGIDLQDSEQINTGTWGTYEDQEKVYWDLLTSLANNIDRIASTSCHIMFWFSMDFYTETQTFFREKISSFEMQSHPLYWHKTDGRGILPDPKRGPRRVMETALIGSRGDRQIVKPVANTYGAPTAKTIHMSEKSRPMLQHFFQMFVDDTTRMIDPTCGSGNALIAANSLGAKELLGLERDPKFAEDAIAAFRKHAILRSLEHV